MVKIVKRRRRIRWDNMIIAFFLLSFVLYLTSMTVVKAQNVVLAKQENLIVRKNETLTKTRR